MIFGALRRVGLLQRQLFSLAARVHNAVITAKVMIFSRESITLLSFGRLMMMFDDLGTIVTRLRVTGVVGGLLLRTKMRADRGQHEAATLTE